MTEYKKQIAAYKNRSADEKYLSADHTNVSAVKTCHLAVQTNHLAVYTNHCAVFLNRGAAAPLASVGLRKWLRPSPLDATPFLPCLKSSCPLPKPPSFRMKPSSIVFSP